MIQLLHIMHGFSIYKCIGRNNSLGRIPAPIGAERLQFPETMEDKMVAKSVYDADVLSRIAERPAHIFLSTLAAARNRTVLYFTTLRKDFSIWLNRRRTIAALEALDDRMLRDVGLTRMNIRAFVSAPNNRDPRLHIPDPKRHSR